MKSNYRMKVYSIDTTDGKEWVAEYIDLSYCVEGGKTKEEAVIEAKEGLKVYIEYLESQGVVISTISDHAADHI